MLLSHQGDDKAFAELYEPRNQRFLGRDRSKADRSCEATSDGFREAKDYFSGVDALTGHTRSHPEHDG